MCLSLSWSKEAWYRRKKDLQVRKMIVVNVKLMIAVTCIFTWLGIGVADTHPGTSSLFTSCLLEEMAEIHSRVLLAWMDNQNQLENKDHRGHWNQLAEIEGMMQMAHQGQMVSRDQGVSRPSRVRRNTGSTGTSRHKWYSWATTGPLEPLSSASVLLWLSTWQETFWKK